VLNAKHAPRRRKLTELTVRNTKPGPVAFLLWDTYQRGLALRVQPTGARSWVTIYRHHGRPRWYYIGDARKLALSDARKLAQRIALAVAEGKDRKPSGEPSAEPVPSPISRPATSRLTPSARTRAGRRLIGWCSVTPYHALASSKPRASLAPTSRR